eukprot:m.298938 g.298938  ORF g.298938 m.298938 type:complete len:345 (-) comp20101_c0_seq14:934-1968(-)
MSSNKEREDVNVDLSHLGKFDSDFGKGIQVDDATREQPWFTSGLPREVVRAMVMEIMSSGKHGEFIVRDKASEAGTFALSVKENLGDKNSLLTFLVEKRGLKLTVRGTGEKFMTLSELIEHYTAEQRDTLGLQLLRPGTYILDAARKAREQLEANPEEAAALIKPNGAGEGSHLPQWLRVDNEIKAEVSQEKRDNVNNATGDGDDGPPVLSRRASRVYVACALDAVRGYLQGVLPMKACRGWLQCVEVCSHGHETCVCCAKWLMGMRLRHCAESDYFARGCVDVSELQKIVLLNQGNTLQCVSTDARRSPIWSTSRLCSTMASSSTSWQVETHTTSPPAIARTI